MGKKKKQKQGRPIVTDVSAVRIGAGTEATYVTSRAFGETADLLCEGEIEGLVSGDYQYMGNAGQTGYSQVVVDLYTATGKAPPSTVNLTASSLQFQLGFLRSIYWNDVPIVDKDAYYNFPSVNVHQVVGGPIGSIPQLSDNMNNYTDMSSTDVLDLSVQRSIGERLYGPEIATTNDQFPTDERVAQIKAGTRIDKYSKTYTILNKECNKIQVNIKINALFENLQAGPKTYEKSSQLAAEGAASAGFGDTKARTVQYSIYYQPVFDQRFRPTSTGTSLSINLDKTVMSPQVWLGPITETVTGKIDQGYVRTTSIDLSKEDLADASFFEGWRIRIVRITPESLTSFLRNISFVDSIVEIYGTQLRYPYSSMVYSQFDARSFSRIPARSYDTRLLKIKVPNNYDPETKTYGRSDGEINLDSYNTKSRRTTGANPWQFSSSSKTGGFWSKIICATRDNNNWDGNFKTEIYNHGSENVAVESTEEIYIKQWCDNPAWCFYDILTNPRYGLGEYLNENDIDKWGLYEIGQYCDVLVPDGYGGLEPRFTFNYLISSREEAFKVINDLASAFRGLAYFSNGSIKAVQDNFKNPITQFTTSNVIGGDFNYASSAKKARHTVAIVRYNDKRNFFKPAVEYVEDEESVRRYGIRELETSALGCTSKGQARRFAKWILASEANETETVSFSVGMEGSYLNPGDIVQIYDNFRSPLKYSGRTNRVQPLVLNDTATESDGIVTPFDGANFDNVIVDQAISFKNNKKYKLDLLTPTYDYPTGTTDVDSSDISPTGGFNRTQLQTVFFSGAHTKTYTGDFKSDYLVSGDGVCTQIFFNTGSAFGGTGNKFDFSNYVITGYTNPYLGTRQVENDVSSSYSGGCFSGQNLIWSCEPASSNDEEFVSGNSSSFRVVNVEESDDGSYAVSALAYSTGKYDKAESAIEFKGKNVARRPLFPTGDIAGRQCEINDVQELDFPWPGSAADRLQPSTALTLKADVAYPAGASSQRSIPRMDRYQTLKVTFQPAGYESETIIYSPPGGSIEQLNAKVKADEALDYAVCISRDANFELPTQADVNKVDATYNRPFAVNHGNWRIFETGIELYIPGKTAGSRSKYGTYDVTDEDNAKIVEYSAEFLLYEPDIADYHVAVFALSKEGVISDGMLSKIKIRKGKRKPQSFSVANAVSISNLKTENIDNPGEKTTMHTIEALEPTFGWQTSYASIVNVWRNPDPSPTDPYPDKFPFLDEPFYELNIAESVVPYRITIRKPSLPNTINMPNSDIYLEFTGYNPSALSADFAFKSTYNDPNVITGLRDQAVDNVDTYPHVTIWKPNLNQITSSTEPELGKVINGANTDSDLYIRNDPSGYITTNNDSLFPLRRYDVVVEAHDSEGKTSARNEVWANTIGDPSKESNWGGSPSKYDIIGINIESPSGLIFASRGIVDGSSNPLTQNWISTYEAYSIGYPYFARSTVYPNGFLDITIQHSEGSGPNAGKKGADDQELEKYFNNIAGIVYYMTTGDNALVFDGAVATAPTKAQPFVIDLKAQVEGNFAHTIKYKINGAENESAGFYGRKSNNFFGGIVTNSEALSNAVHDDYQMQRGYYLLTDSDSVDSLHLPLPLVTNPAVENIQLAIGFFDDLSLLRGFESDGKTPKFVGTSDADNTKMLTPKIFTDPDINLSTIPADLTKKFIVGIPWNRGANAQALEAAGTSVYMGESSVMGAGDTALAFRGWGEVGLNSAGMSPHYDGDKNAWTRKATVWSTLDAMDWTEINIDQAGDLTEYPKDSGTDQLPTILESKNCIFKGIALGAGLKVRYKMTQFYKVGGRKRIAHAARIQILLEIDPSKIPFDPSKYMIMAEMDGGDGIDTTVTVVKPEEGAVDSVTRILYRMEKSWSEKRGTYQLPYPPAQLNYANRYQLNDWVPSLIKVRFALLATNQ